MFIAALASHEGGVYLIATGIGSVAGFIALGPLAMAAIVMVFLGTGGAVGVAAHAVWEDCGLGGGEN
jgi:hypothetical protein